MGMGKGSRARVAAAGLTMGKGGQGTSKHIYLLPLVAMYRRDGKILSTYPRTDFPRFNLQTLMSHGNWCGSSLPVPWSLWCCILTWAPALDFLANEAAEQSS